MIVYPTSPFTSIEDLIDTIDITDIPIEFVGAYAITTLDEDGDLFEEILLPDEYQHKWGKHQSLNEQRALKDSGVVELSIIIDIPATQKAVDVLTSIILYLGRIEPPEG